MNKSDGDSDTLSHFDHKEAYTPEKKNLKYYCYHNKDKDFLNFLLKKKGISGKRVVELNADYAEFKKSQKTKTEEQGEELTFTFGKYEGRRIGEILRHGDDEEQQYLKWVAFELSGNKRAESRFLERFFYYHGVSPTNVGFEKTDDKESRRPRGGRYGGNYKRQRRRSRSRSPRRRY